MWIHLQSEVVITIIFCIFYFFYFCFWIQYFVENNNSDLFNKDIKVYSEQFNKLEISKIKNQQTVSVSALLLVLSHM